VDQSLLENSLKGRKADVVGWATAFEGIAKATASASHKAMMKFVIYSKLKLGLQRERALSMLAPD
jgi:hypothetical protein